MKIDVYIVIFDIMSNMSNDLTDADIFLSNSKYFVGDDQMERPTTSSNNLDDVVQIGLDNNLYDYLYFPDENNKITIPFISCLKVDVAKQIREYRYQYNDLTDNYKNIYNILKLLNANKEIRILTFNDL